jgi:hypothetical protein
MVGWLATGLVLAASAETVTFEFHGQPECVKLAVPSVETITLTNTCPGPVLVDQRAQGPAVVAPGASVSLAGISGFTVGVDGALHAVVAVPVRGPG